MKLYIKNYFTGEVIIIEAEPSYTGENIVAIIENKTQIPISEQRLLFAGKILEYHRPLSDYNIKDESTIYLQLKNTGCVCYAKYGEQKYRISKFCGCCSNTLYLKERVSELIGIEPSNIELIVDGKIMEDSKSLDSYNI